MRCRRTRFRNYRHRSTCAHSRDLFATNAASSVEREEGHRVYREGLSDRADAVIAAWHETRSVRATVAKAAVVASGPALAIEAARAVLIGPGADVYSAASIVGVLVTGGHSAWRNEEGAPYRIRQQVAVKKQDERFRAEFLLGFGRSSVPGTFGVMPVNDSTTSPGDPPGADAIPPAQGFASPADGLGRDARRKGTPWRSSGIPIAAVQSGRKRQHRSVSGGRRMSALPFEV